MFILIHKHIYSCRDKTNKNTYLERACPATNYVTATFHPTIGQYAHQYISNTTTPELGMITTRNKGTLASSHIAKGISKFIQTKHSCVYHDVREVERLNF